ncbi:pirin family protein [uncultured Piscinibacter sp.]|uniref:pirin family protein n=1 Tax=uncultured Piscinibacter sp. TaxID=1131835 RepID=UPI0026302B75|nr:pirin family protein [uncultured Piscinibacter sp.]
MSHFEIRRSATRGAMRTDWLDARFSFSFADHVDPHRPRFGPLLALNEDRVQPGTGFPMHPHRDLEIVMLPRSGSVEHRDSEGRHMLVRPGELQWMRAGRGIRHRQWNASSQDVDHHFQLWFAPSAIGLEPTVECLAYEMPAPGAWRTLVSPGPQDGALDIGVDGVLALGCAAPGRALKVAACATGGLYLHVMHGRVEVHGAGIGLAALEDGDAIVFFDGMPELQLQAVAPAELLRFDTAGVDRRTGLTACPTLSTTT